MLTLRQVVRVFECLNARKAKYLVIGGIACGVPRSTNDLDLADLEYLERIARSEK